MAKKINWEKLKKNKKSIVNFRKKEGLEGAIHYSEGLLGLERGEYTKNRPRIKRIIMSF